MTKPRIFFGLLVFSFFYGMPAVSADLSSLAPETLDELKNWHLYGDTNVHYDYYHIDGDETQYPFDRNQVYNEYRFGFDREFSPYESVRGSTSALLNGSRYRHEGNGWIFEDARFHWEKGDAGVPFRLDLGDYAANLSQRTLEQSLKGFQLELQPEFEIAGKESKNSIIAFTGVHERDYDDFDVNSDLFSGLSWLTGLGNFGNAGINAVHNYRDWNAKKELPEHQQFVSSITYENVIPVLTESLNIEAELAQLAGDVESPTVARRIDEEKYGQGAFVQISGSNQTPFSYGFRFEHYTDDFRASGAVITPNRRTLSWNAGWKFKSGLRFDGRIEMIRDQLDNRNHQDTRVYGLTFAGPVENPWLHDLNVYLDIFRESVDDVDRFANIRTFSYVGDVSAKIYKEWSGRLGVSAQNARDKFIQSQVIPRQFTADLSHPLSVWDANGSMRLGSVWRNTTGTVSSDEYGPSAGFSLEKGRHQVNASWETLFENSHVAFGQDVSSFNFNSGYIYTLGPHRFNFEMQINNRNPDESSEHTEEYVLKFSYSLSFDKAKGVDVRDFSWKEGYPVPKSTVEDVSLQAISSETQWLDATSTGAVLPDVQNRLNGLGISGGSTSGALTVFETRIFESFRERQRLFLKHPDGIISRSGLVIDLDPSVDDHRARQIYEKLRRVLLRRFGNPSLQKDEGEWSPKFREDLQAGRLVRLTEWETPNGLVRLGIPKRRDGRVRIELHQRKDMPPAQEAYWSLEEIV